MENYIVRIYRRGEEDRPGVMGTVEEVGEEEKKSFTNAGELWDIINSKKPPIDCGIPGRKKRKRRGHG